MFKRNSAGSHDQSHFSRIPSVSIQRSVFDRTKGYKTTFDEGLLYPIYVEEVLPGDTVRLNMSHLVRLLTPIYPYMDNVYLDFHFFFVPNRLVWDNWEKFNGAQDNPDDSTDFLLPDMVGVATTGFQESTVMDYMGIPTKIADLDLSNVLPLRAYNLIWNEWYRDENLQDSVVVDKDDGPDAYNDYKTVLPRGKRKDYFTSALPWPQKGPAVSLPLGTQAPVRGDGVTAQMPIHGVTSGVNTRLIWTTANGIQAAAAMTNNENVIFQGGELIGAYADLSAATAATINQLRQAFQIQRLYERDARGGTRYIEILLSHFGVVSPDFRLQRPEYLGGGSSPLNVNPVAQTSSTDATTPQGNLSAFAVSSRSGIGFNHSFVEHGHIIGLLSVRADMTYQQGLNRMWSRSTRFDFYWPALSHLGEQAIFNKEIYAQATTADDDIFGYQERYAEYRFSPSQVTGKFRSNATGTLDAWHLAYKFTSLPALDDVFVKEAPPIARVVAVPDEPHFQGDFHFQQKWTRPMPVYSVPGLIDHF